MSGNIGNKSSQEKRCITQVVSILDALKNNRNRQERRKIAVL